MVSARSLALFALLCALAVSAAVPAPRLSRPRRQLADDDALQPLEDEAGDAQTREKRKLEGVTQAKFGIKNAVLGFVFGKINSLIDAKTRLVDNLDRKNIELNKQYGIEAPKGGLASLSGIVGQVIGPKLQLIGPLLGGASGGGGDGGQGGSGLGSILSLVTSLSGSSSGGSGGGDGGSGGSGLGSILSLATSLSGSSSGGAAAAGTVETVDSDEDDS